MASGFSAPRGTFINKQGSQFFGNTFNADTIFIAGEPAAGAEADEESVLAKLPHAPEAAFNHISRQGHPVCLPNTRTQVLNDIMAWARGEVDGGECIYWLNGMAGTGKSTIARTVARACCDEERLGASFFFSRGGGEIETARMFVTSIAMQLARRLPRLKKLICAALRSQPDVVIHSFYDQWKQLVLRPVETCAATDRSQLPWVIVIDALDECNNKSEIEFVLQLLSATAGLMTSQLLIFLTSRPGIPIRQGFEEMDESQRRHLILHRVEPIVVDHDISIFFESRLGKLMQSLPSPWGSSRLEVMEELVHRAGGLFIWAATACLFIQKGRSTAKNRLKAILERKASGAVSEPEKALDAIYEYVLHSALRNDYNEDEQAELCDSLRTILGAIAISFSSLSASSLESLLYLDENTVQDALCDLHSILDVPKDLHLPIRPQHASVRDYLLNNARCTDLRFWVNEHRAHMHMASCCIQLMDDNLHKDMLGLGSPGTLKREVSGDRIDRRFPSHLRYACLYWVQHIERSKRALDLRKRVNNFLLTHLLHWLESLSWLEKLDDALEMVKLLEALYDEDIFLLAVTNDVVRFMHYNRYLLDEAPLQAYVSAVMFAPYQSKVRQIFSKQLPPWITTLPVVRDDWSRELQILAGHGDDVTAVVFSSDGRLLASASCDKTIRLWNAKTGASFGTLDGHSDCVTSVAFSTDSQLLASASADMTVRLWNAKTRAACGTLRGHADRVIAVAVSPDSELLASASDDKTVRLWNAKTRAPCGTLVGHEGSVGAIAFSPDSQLLASASADKTVWLWNVKIGAACGTLYGNRGAGRVLALSPDSQILASASDMTVRLWNAKTLAPCGTLTGHSGQVRAVAFSPDGTLLASASTDKTVQLWDAETGSPCGTLDHSSEFITGVAFSPDSEILASAFESTVCLWNAKAEEDFVTLESHENMVMALAFSIDSQLLATACSDIRLWNTKTGEACGSLEGRLDIVHVVVFSPDGQLLAASDGYNIRLWNARTGAGCGALMGHTDSVLAVAFSPDSQLLASASYDGVVMLWDAKTGTAWSTLNGHFHAVRAVAFSPDSKLLASASSDKTVCLWNVETRAACGTLRGHSSEVWAVAISPDSQLLASASSDDTVWLWNCATGALLTVFQIALTNYQLSFSSDGFLLQTDIGPIPIRPHTEADAPSGYGMLNQWLLTTTDDLFCCYMSVAMLRWWHTAILLRSD